MTKRGNRAGTVLRIKKTIQMSPDSIVIPSRPDGHCLLWSIASSWRAQQLPGFLTKQLLIEKILLEIDHRK